MENFIRDLHYKLSKGPAILTKEEAAFEAAYERWTEIDRKTPAVIVHPACEQDLAILVEKAHAAKVPFVPTTGGHSPWSTVEHGIVIDMSCFKEIVVGPDRHTVVVRGGVLMKNLQLALSGKGQFTSTNGTRHLLEQIANLSLSCCKWQHCRRNSICNWGRHQLLHASYRIRV